MSLTGGLLRMSGLIILFATGFAGLVYEVTWHKYLANLFGSQAQATAVILSVFLGGLSLGYALFGRYSRNRSPRAVIKALGWCEMAIGAWGLLFPTLYQVVWNYIGVIDPAGPFVFALDFAIACLLILLPTTLMGGTLPLITQGMAADLGDASVFHARAYALNSAGAFVGTLIAGFVLLPWHGLPLTTIYMGVLNLIAGLIFVGIGTRLPDAVVESPAPAPAPSETRAAYVGLSRGGVVAFLSGFYGIALQALLIRLTGLSFGSSEYAFSIIVGVYIAALSIGAWALADRPAQSWSLGANQFIALMSALGLFFLAPLLPYANHHIRIAFQASSNGFYAYHAAIFLAMLVLLIIPIGTFGRTMPLLFSVCKTRFHRIGADIGLLYSLNTLGCVFGAIVGGYFLFFWFDLDQLLKISILLVASSWMFSLNWTQLTKPRLLWASGTLVAVGLVVIALPPWPKENFAHGTFRNREPLARSYLSPKTFYQKQISNYRLISASDGPNASVSILESKHDQSVSVLVNGKSDGNTKGDLPTMSLVAHLSAMLSTHEAGRACVIGFGTGISVGELLRYPTLEHVDLYEISQALRQAASHLDPYNGRVAEHERVTWHMGDAYRGLVANDTVYDVILSEPSNPWIAGIEKLYSREFYEATSQRLSKDGAFLQWINLYAASESMIGMVFSTLASVFPEIYAFTTQGDLLIVAKKTPLAPSTLARAADHFEQPSINAAMQQIDIHSFAELLGREVWLPSLFFREAGQQTLEFPKLAFQAGRDFFLGSSFKPAVLSAKPHLRSFQMRFNRSLVYQYAALFDGPKASAVLADALPSLCRKSNLEEVEWKYANYACLKTAMQLAAEGQLSPPPKLSALLHWASYGLTPDQNPNTLTSHEAWLSLVALEITKTEFWTPTRQKLQQLSQICQRDSSKTFTCQLQLSRLLALNGDLSAAFELYQQLAKDEARVQAHRRQMAETLMLMTETMRADQLAAHLANANTATLR